MTVTLNQCVLLYLVGNVGLPVGILLQVVANLVLVAATSCNYDVRIPNEPLLQPIEQRKGRAEWV